MDQILNYWYLFVAIYPIIAAVLRAVAEGLIASGNVLHKPELSSIGSSLGAFLISTGRIIGFFGVGTPKIAQK